MSGSPTLKGMRKGNLADAQAFLEAPPPNPFERMQAAIGVAMVLVCDKNNKEGAAQAAQFLKQAFDVHDKLKAGAAPWVTFQLGWVALRTPEYASKGKELINSKSLPANFKRRLQLESILVQLEKADPKAGPDLVKELPDAGGPERGLAWIALGRHLGSASPMPEETGEDAHYAVFVKVGRALGTPEPKK